MEKYIIRVNAFESEINGIRNSQNFEYIFENKPLIESREDAIEMVIDLTTYMAYGTDNEFISLSKARKEDLDFFNAYTIELLFSPEEGTEYQIFGEESTMVPSLCKEAEYYKKMDYQPLMKLYGRQGEEVEVIESYIDFFIST